MTEPAQHQHSMFAFSGGPICSHFQWKSGWFYPIVAWIMRAFLRKRNRLWLENTEAPKMEILFWGAKIKNDAKSFFLRFSRCEIHEDGAQLFQSFFSGRGNLKFSRSKMRRSLPLFWAGLLLRFPLLSSGSKKWWILSQIHLITKMIESPAKLRTC